MAVLLAHELALRVLAYRGCVPRWLRRGWGFPLRMFLREPLRGLALVSSFVGEVTRLGFRGCVQGVPLPCGGAVRVVRWLPASLVVT